MRKFIFFIFLIFLFSAGIGVQAAQLGESLTFKIDELYDISGREELTATVIKITPKLYFYAEKDWWEKQNNLRQSEIVNKLETLSQEFERKIYPDLTSAFGPEWKPGVDNDERIFILLHQMREGVGGYFRTADNYLKIQFPESNEKETIYLNISQIENPQAKTYLAHEFLHLITFNQKERIQNSQEETWLNEARSEYAATFLGYDSSYEGSNLQQRVKAFIESPADSLTEWLNKKQDYGVVNLFIQYLVDHYGIGTLTDSLEFKEVGITSINKALEKNGFKDTFDKIFTDWLIAVLVNDCSLGKYYCYLSQNLKTLKITPSLNFLPLVGKSTLSITDVTKDWSGNWLKFTGGKGVLKIEFSALAGTNFKVPYLVQDKTGKYSLNLFTLDKNQKGEIYISDFGTGNVSLFVIPSLQSKISGFDGVEQTFPYTITLSIVERTPEQEAELTNELLAQIDFLKKEIAKVQAQIDAILGKKTSSCDPLSQDLYYGLMNNSQVSCLQEFLKSQGSEIYPDSLITGNFLSLTQSAVIRFQEKYAAEILTPLGLNAGTGFVGSRTREKINQLLSG